MISAVRETSRGNDVDGGWRDYEPVDRAGLFSA
jgi:hypothetical protein